MALIPCTLSTWATSTFPDGSLNHCPDWVCWRCGLNKWIPRNASTVSFVLLLRTLSLDTRTVYQKTPAGCIEKYVTCPCSLWSWSQINSKTDEDCIPLKNKSGNLLHVLLLLAGSFFVLCYPPLQSTCTYTISAELPRLRLSLPNQPLLWVIISLGYRTGIHAVLAWQQAMERNTKDEKKEKEDPISQLQHCNYIVIFFLAIKYAMTDKGQGQE